MVTTVIALSISLLVFVAACVALVAVVAISFRRIGELENGRSAVVGELRAARTALVDKSNALTAEQATAVQLRKQRDYNGEQLTVFQRRSNQLTDCIREMLLAVGLGSTVGDDPLDTDVAVIVGSLDALARNAKRAVALDAFVTTLMRRLGQPSTSMALESHLSMMASQLDEVFLAVSCYEQTFAELLQVVPAHGETLGERLGRSIAAVRELKAKLEEKTGKLNHYRVAIDEALGGVRGDNERWSVVHVQAIQALQARVKAAEEGKLDEAIEGSLAPLCEAAGCGPEDLLEPIGPGDR